GDVGVAGGAELVDGEAAQGGHVLRAVSGADLGGVLTEGGVPDEVEPVFDDPVRPQDLRDAFRGCLAAGQVGDDVDGLAALLAVFGAGAVAYGLGGLGGVREVDGEVGDGQGLHDSGLLAAVAGGAVVELRRRLLPGQGAQLGVEVLLVAFHGEGVVGPLPFDE